MMIGTAMSVNPDARWIATIHYKSEAGIVDVDYPVEELEEIADLVEHGPDWNTITKIEVVLNPKRRSYDVTVEQAELM